LLGVTQKYGIHFADLPAHCLDAVDAAERTRARTLVVRGAQAVAAIVPMSDFDRVDPPDPGASGQDPLLALCGSCRHDEFVDTFVTDLSQTTLWSAGRLPPRELRYEGPNTAKAGSPPGWTSGPQVATTVPSAPIPPRPAPPRR
jgi:hypothetical protein